MAARYSNPVPQYSDINGVPFAGGKLQFFDTGTTTPKDVFSDAAGTISLGNELTLDGSGNVPDFFGEGNYRVRQLDSALVQQFERDDVIIQSPQSAQLSAWDIATTYSINDLVQGTDGEYYISVTNSNLGNNPVTDLVNWSEVTFLAVWNPNVTYSAQNIVIGSDGNIYRSITNSNLNNDPISSPAEWAAAINTSALNIVLPQGYKNDLRVTINVSDSAHDVDFQVGVAKDIADTLDIKFTSILTKRIDANFAEGNNAGGFPSALSLSADTRYYIFALVKDDGTVDGGFDDNVDATNLLVDATNFTKFRLIGELVTDASSNIDTINPIPTTIVQIKQFPKTDTFSTASTSFVDITGFTAEIRPLSAFNKILIMVSMDGAQSASASFADIKLVRDSTDINIGDAAGSRTLTSLGGIQSNTTTQHQGISMSFIDEPATTSNIIYKLQVRTGASTYFVNRGFTDTDSASFSRGASSITLMEIGVPSAP